MKAFERIGAAIALTFVLAFAALADCLPPEPGIVNAPPCLGTQITPDDPVASAEPSESNSSVAEISVTTLDLLIGALSRF